MTGHGSNLFSIRLHYGGDLKHYPKKEYLGGKVDMVDWCDPDKWSLCELDDLAASLGLDKYSMRYYYCIPDKTMADGLICMVNDHDALRAADLGAKFRLIDIYMVKKAEKVYLDEASGKEVVSPPRKRIKTCARKRVKTPTKFSYRTAPVARELDVEVEIDLTGGEEVDGETGGNELAFNY